MADQEKEIRQNLFPQVSFFPPTHLEFILMLTYLIAREGESA